MKRCVVGFLMLALIAGVQLHAQQSDANRKRFEQSLAKAENGDAMAQCTLAELYQVGLGVATNHEEAFKWYRKSADQGDAVAQNNLVCATIKATG